MINEITTYIKGIQEQFPLQTFVKEPSRGLHIMFEVKDNQVQFYKKELFLPKKNEEGNASDFLVKECMPREMHINYIESHKALIGKEGKKIHSASPYALKIRKKSFDEEWKSWYPGKKVPDEENKPIKEKSEVLETLIGDERKVALTYLMKTKISTTSDSIRNLIERYFVRANEICLEEEDVETSTYQKYLIAQLPAFLKDISDELIKLSKEDNIFILFKNKNEEEHKIANENYLLKYIFNVDYYNKFFNGENFGLSGYMNTASDNKPYLKHLTSNFDISYRISQSQALLLYTFERYRKIRAFKTNPLPIFIDKTELNKTVVNVIKKEGNDVKFNTIIRKLFEHSKNDLGNYYLLYFDYQGELKDMDFVSSFDYGLDLKIKKIIPTVKLENDYTVKNIFEFETNILQSIYSNQLIQFRKNGKVSYRYFDEIDNNPKYISASQWNLVMKYRKSFYDWIYKSRKQAVNNSMFHDILNKMILDDIRRDELTINPKTGKNIHTKETDIINKLNIWFSLWNYFSNTTISNDLTMANKITELQDKVLKILGDENEEHIITDDEFAFFAGQLIYYLLYQSKAANKTHALLEPFIQKTNTNELKKVITKTFDAYKHEIYFSNKKFGKIYSEVMSYDLTEKSLKELIPILLAGYFSDSKLFN